MQVLDDDLDGKANRAFLDENEDKKIDAVAYDDANVGIIGEQRILDLGVDFYSPSQNMSVGVYGKNLNDYVKHGNISPVSWGSFAPLMTGKVVGVELVYDF